MKNSSIDRPRWALTSVCSLAPPSKQKVRLANPAELFSRNAFHGGAMRCLYKFTSIGEAAALIHYAGQYGLVLAAAAAAAVGLAVSNAAA